MNRDDYFSKAKRVVVKVGSHVLTADQGINISVINSLSRQISKLMDDGREVIMVTSGAMASGQKKIGLAKKPDEIPKRQAIAAVGQAGLMMEYEKAFSAHQKKVAQILLTRDDLSNRKRYLNARNTLYTLLSWKVIPIINENDTVAIDEIKFGDNDTLSAMISLLMEADMLINLTDIGGLFSGDPSRDPNARLIPEVEAITKQIEKIAGDTAGSLGTGGMSTKIKAARKVIAAGIPMIIASGRDKDILIKLFKGKTLGTFFVPAKEKLSSRKCWIGYTLKPKGKIRIDDGAAVAIVKKGKSLLPGGITHVEGEFDVGAPVEVIDSGKNSLAVGLVNYSASDIKKIMGISSAKIKERLGEKTYDEVIHRDNLTVFNECVG